MKNIQDKKHVEWRKPTISKLEVSLTKGGTDPSNNENNNKYPSAFGGNNGGGPPS